MRKKLKTGKNLLIVSKSSLVTIVRTWGLLKFSVSEKLFNASKFWLILSKSIFDFRNGIHLWENNNIRLSHRESLLSQLYFFLNWNSLITNTTYTFFYKYQINSVQLQMNICGFPKNLSSKERMKPCFFSYFHRFSSIIWIFWHFLVTKKLMTPAYNRWRQHIFAFNLF